jgi:hypothetical protein
MSLSSDYTPIIRWGHSLLLALLQGLSTVLNVRSLPIAASSRRLLLWLAHLGTVVQFVNGRRGMRETTQQTPSMSRPPWHLLKTSQGVCSCVQAVCDRQAAADSSIYHSIMVNVLRWPRIPQIWSYSEQSPYTGDRPQTWPGPCRK